MTVGVDLVKKPGMELRQLESMLTEINAQPSWRDEAQRAAAYYDNKQLTPKQMQEHKDRGTAPLVYNLIGPTIDAVLGIEAKTRTDWIVRADDNKSREVAEGINEKLNEASRMSMASRARSDGYAAQVKTGLAWVEVNRNSDPFDYAYRTNYISRNEIHWDWHAKRPDLRDARYLVRERWLDEDRAMLAFPQHADLVKMAVTGWGDWSSLLVGTKPEQLVELTSAYTEYQDTVFAEDTWFDTERRRVRVFEVWYRTVQRGAVLKLKDGRVIEFDKLNPIHRTAVALEHAKPIVGSFQKMRLAYFLGCHRIVDVPSPLPHDNFPYVPFWGFREDGTGIPYGLIRRMMSPQDEVNARRSKMMWLLSAKRTIMDRDATAMDIEEITDEVQRPDGVILLNPSRQNRDQYAFRIEQDFQLAAQQFEIMVESQKMIQDTAGVYSALMGRQDSGADSGVAIASLVEQGSTTLAELNDNYRFASRLMGEHLMALILQDLKGEETEVAVNLNKPQKTKYIQLNQRVVSEDGVVEVNNDVTRAKMQVALDDIQATAGYRAQIANRLFELVATVPDEVKVALLDVVVDATDIPQREEIIKRIRQVTGMGVDPEEMTEEERAAAQQKQAMAQRTQELAIEEMAAKIAKLQASAARDRAGAENTDAQTASQKYADRKTDAETDKILAEMQQILGELNAMNKSLNAQVEDGAATIKAYESVLPDVMRMRATAPASKPAAAKPAGPKAVTRPQFPQRSSSAG